MGNIYSMAGMLISVINQREFDQKILPADMQILQNPKFVDSWRLVEACLRRIAEALFLMQTSEQQESSGNTVEFLRKYIKTHITEDVSLVKLSEVSGYNAVYLTRIYKKNTGETINDYISRQKLRKISDLMADNSLSLGDISIKAGFEYRSYFSKFIKKMTGISPNELRKQNTNK